VMSSGETRLIEEQTVFVLNCAESEKSVFCRCAYCIAGNIGGGFYLAILAVWVDCAKSNHRQI